MGAYKNFMNTVNDLLNEAKKNNIIHLKTKRKKINNNIIDIGRGDTVNFGSCSYLGLEFDNRVKSSSIDAIKNYGTQFSSSRAYVSISLYEEYEKLLSQIFEAHVVVTPTTTLGHIATIPNIIDDKDAVILDHQVHASVQNAVNLLKPRKIHVELVRHNNMKKLEERIVNLLNNHSQVWYMADGIYSMYGDELPAKEIELLLNKYKNFRLYVDDAHGMSWAGKNGKGFTLSKMDLHPQMILATSLNKSFASGGGVMVFPSQEQANLIKNCGGPMVTSGPLQPANLGAGIAVAKIHLTNEIYELQQGLIDNINYTNLMLQNSNLPIVFNSKTPIFFIGTSLPKIAYKIIQRMLADGFYLNLGMFPAVPMKNTGVRFTITRLHTFDQIEAMVKSLERHYFDVINEENFSFNNIYNAFKIKPPQESLTDSIINNIKNSLSLKTEHYKSIKEIKKSDWDNYFKNKGTFDWDGLYFLENSFSNNILDANNWEFDYLIVRNENNEIIMATFFTTTISKDDMFAPHEVSLEIEKERKINPAYLTSKTLFMGSLFSEGEHLYLDKTSPNWKNALSILFEKIDEIKKQRKATNIILRDFSNIPDELNTIFIENGYYKYKMPNNFKIENIDWNNENEYLEKLSSNSRKQIKKHIIKHKHLFSVKKIKECIDINKIKEWYNLYLNVKQKSLELNTYDLPFKLFEEMSKNPKWIKTEVITQNKTVAIVFSYVNESSFNPMLIGVDYNLQSNISFYRQAVYQTIMHTTNTKSKTINLGFSADIEKKRLGAKAFENYAFICTDDTYNQSEINNISTNTTKLATS